MNYLYIPEIVQFFLTMIGVIIFTIWRSMKEDK
jgi:hypothetical protein